MNGQIVFKILGILTGAASLLIGLIVIVGEGIPGLRFLLFFILAPGLALAAFMLPSKLVDLNLKLALIWPAGILMAMGGYLALTSVGLLILPLAVIILGLAVYLTLKSPQQSLDWLLIFPAAFLSWSVVLAGANSGTVRAINRLALIAAAILAVFLAIRRRLVQSWVIAAVLVVFLSPLLVEAAANYVDFGQGGSYRRFEPMARRIIYDHPKSTDERLTRLFKAEGQKTLRRGEKFSASIKREGNNAFSVSWQVMSQDKQSAFSGGFYVGVPPPQKGPIRMSLPPKDSEK